MSRLADGTEKLVGEAGVNGRGNSSGRPEIDQSKRLAIEAVPELFCHPRPSNHVLGPERSYKAAWERFRFLEHRLRRVRETRPLTRILVSSCVPKEGKTVVAVNLAITLARNSSRVLLIDADLRRPGIRYTLGLPEMPGLAECLDGRAKLAEVIRRVTPFGFYHLASGHTRVNPLDLLQRSSTAAVVEQCREFDWTIIDSPPIEPFADAQCLSLHVDMALLVIRAGMTRQSDLKDALAMLGSDTAIGVVLNACDDPRHDGYYGRYRKHISADGSTEVRT